MSANTNPQLDAAAGFPVRVGDVIQIDMTLLPPEDPGPVTMRGKVREITDDFIVLDEGPTRGEQEYVLNAGFYGAHGHLDGIIDALKDGRAAIHIKSRR